MPLGCTNDRSKGIHDDRSRPEPLDLEPDAFQHAIEILLENFLTQVDEVHVNTDARGLEKFELLLVAQHLDRRLAKDSEKKCWKGWRGVAEENLLCQRRLSRSRCPGD